MNTEPTDTYTSMVEVIVAEMQVLFSNERVIMLWFQKGVVRGTELALKYMGKDRGGKGGAVVNVASVAGLGKNSACPVYDGTKSFVVGYSRSISVSCKHYLTCLCCEAITHKYIGKPDTTALQLKTL